MEWINDVSGGVDVRIRAVPRAAKNKIQGLYNNALKVRLTSAPVDGKTNQALIRVLSKSLAVPKSRIRLLQGETNHNKLIRIDGLSKENVMAKLEIK